MTSMKRFALAALSAIALTLFTGSPARAQTTLTNTGVEPGASGTATLTDVFYVSTWTSATGYSAWDIYGGHLILRCEGLTPGAKYGVGPTGIETTKNWELKDTYSYFTASDDGTLDVAMLVIFRHGFWYWDGQGWVSGGFRPYHLSVARRVKGKYTGVLTGTVTW